MFLNYEIVRWDHEMVDGKWDGKSEEIIDEMVKDK